MVVFLEFQAKDDENNSADGEFHRDYDEVSLDSFIDILYNNNPSDYYGSSNVSRWVDSAEDDAF